MKRMKSGNNWRRLCTIGLLGMALFITSACGASQSQTEKLSQGTSETTQAGVLQAPTLDNTPVKDHYAVFDTSEGTFKVRLFGTKTPITVKNFDYLVTQGYYTNLTFHRVIDDFMIQGGDDGKGGPGYTIPDEFVNELHFNKMGLLAMANRGPNTGGAQFFITLGPTPWLDNKHTIFGVVTQGMDVVAKIGKVATDKKDKPITPVVIKSITLEPITDTQGRAK